MHWQGDTKRTKAEFNWKISIPNQLPVINTTAFKVEDTPQAGLNIGTLDGEDADGDELKYSIKMGNEKGIFSIDENTGMIMFDQADLISKTVYTLDVEVTDNYDITPERIVIEVPYITTSVDDELERGINVYPNPADDVVSLELPDGLTIQAIVLHDSKGKTLKTYATTERSLKVGDLEQGIYFIKVIANRKQYIRKIAIIH